MTEEILQSKIKSLKRIEPSKDYSASSRMLLLSHKTDTKLEQFEISEDKRIIAKLEALKAITPDANYAFQTKLSILESGNLIHKLDRNRLIELFTFRSFINSSLALGLTAVLVGILITGGYKYLAPAPSLSLADNNALLAEAETIRKDIDIHLREVEYYASAARKTDLALNDASISNYGHLSDRIIEREAQKIDVGSPVNQNVNELLNEATF